KEAYVNALKKRNFDAEDLFDTVITLDDKRRSTQTQLDETKAKSNQLSKKIGELYKNGEPDKANDIKAETSALKEKSKALTDQLKDAEQLLDESLLRIPNMPHESVPFGKSEDDNEEIFREGAIPQLSETAEPHWELAKKYDLIDFELGN